MIGTDWKLLTEGTSFSFLEGHRGPGNMVLRIMLQFECIDPAVPWKNRRRAIAIEREFIDCMSCVPLEVAQMMRELARGIDEWHREGFVLTKNSEGAEPRFLDEIEATITESLAAPREQE